MLINVPPSRLHIYAATLSSHALKLQTLQTLLLKCNGNRLNTSNDNTDDDFDPWGDACSDGETQDPSQRWTCAFKSSAVRVDVCLVDGDYSNVRAEEGTTCQSILFEVCGMRVLAHGGGTEQDNDSVGVAWKSASLVATTAAKSGGNSAQLMSVCNREILWIGNGDGNGDAQIDVSVVKTNKPHAGSSSVGTGSNSRPESNGRTNNNNNNNNNNNTQKYNGHNKFFQWDAKSESESESDSDHRPDFPAFRDAENHGVLQISAAVGVVRVDVDVVLDSLMARQALDGMCVCMYICMHAYLWTWYSIR
jgi:hypothetical protein